jgi:hypothetical protein
VLSGSHGLVRRTAALLAARSPLAVAAARIAVSLRAPRRRYAAAAVAQL